MTARSAGARKPVSGNKNPWTSAPPLARRQFTVLVLAKYGDICHICKHGGARQVDHLEPVTERPELAWILDNARMAHGAPGNRCKICHENCNQLRGGYSAERARKLINQRTQDKAQKKPPARETPDRGREF